MTRREQAFFQGAPHKPELRPLLLMVHDAIREATGADLETWEQVQEFYRPSNVRWDEIPSLAGRLSQEEVLETLASAVTSCGVLKYNSSGVRKLVKALREKLQLRLGEHDSSPHAPIVLHAPDETPEGIITACYSQVRATRAVLDRLSNLGQDQPRKRGVVRALCIERPQRNLDRVAQFAEIVDDDDWRPVLITALTTARRIYACERWCGAVYNMAEPPVQFQQFVSGQVTVDCSSPVVGERYATDYRTVFRAWVKWCDDESVGRDIRTFARYAFLYGALNLLPILDFAAKQVKQPVAHLLPRWMDDLHGRNPSSLASGKAVERLPYLLGIEPGVNVWDLLGQLVTEQAKADQKVINELVD